MGDAEERKKAKEAYMKALEAQRQKPVEVASAVQGGGQGAPVTAAQKREQQLEERRRKFFDKTSSDTGSAGENKYNGRETEPSTQPYTAPTAAKGFPKSTEAEIRPSDWKSKGYPSEYAYMKDAGQLSIPSKPVVDIPSLNSFAVNMNFAALDQPPLFQSHQQQASSDQLGEMRNKSMVGGGGLNIGNVNDKVSQKQKQNDYTRALDQQSNSQVQPGSDNQQFGSHFLTYNSNNPMNGGGALNIGAVDNKEQKRQKQAEYARALDQQAHPQAAELHQDTKVGITNKLSSYSVNGGGGGGLNIGGAADDKDVKRQKQADYARALDQQSYAHPPTDAHHQSKALSQHNANISANGNGGGGLNIGAVDDKEAKRQRQAEYARALDQQSHSQPQVNSHHQAHHQENRTSSYKPSNEMVGGGGLNFGAPDDKEQKRLKQAEYARALDQQAHAQPHHATAATANHFASHNAQAVVNGGGDGGLNIGGAADDKDVKRQKQADYARALDQQSYAHPPAASHQASRLASQHHANDSMNGGGGLNIGAVDDKEAKRQRQAEYAQALGQQQQNDAWGGGGRGGGVESNQANGLGLAGIGGPGPQEAAFAKRQQQQEYTSQLNQAQYQQPAKLNKFGEYQLQGGREQQTYLGGEGLAGLGGLQGKEAVNAKRQQQQDYTSQLNAQAQYLQPAKLNKFGEYEQPGRHQVQQQTTSGARPNDISSIGSGDDGRQDKRAKQAQYNRALQQQQYLQSLQQPVRDKNAEKRAAAPSVATGFNVNGGLEEGWVIGPMGLPVRKTLDVGNRGVQRAYANHIAETQSPTKPNASAFEGNAHGRGFDMESYQQAAHMLNSPPQFGGQLGRGEPGGGFHAGGPASVMNGDIGGNPDDRAMKVKMQQAEQARVLEMQMLANKERKAAEKKRIDEEDKKEMQRMEMQRIAIQQELEREAHEKKMKIDEDNRKVLERQMEMKKAEKEMEEAREKERVEREEARVRAEAEVIRRRQELEMQQEAAAAQRQEQQRQQAQELQQRQREQQAEALHRQHAPVVHQVPEEYYEVPEQRDGAFRDSSGGARGNNRLFDRPEAFQPTSHGGAPSGSRGGARDRSHLFSKPEDDDIYDSVPIHTNNQQMLVDRNSHVPMSPGKWHVDRVLADRLQYEREEVQPDGLAQPTRQQQSRQQHEVFEVVKEVGPPILNLNNLKRNISEGAVVSGRRSARGAGRGHSRVGTATKASPHDPYHPERELEEVMEEDTFSPLPMHRPPSRALLQQNVQRSGGSRLQENQYVPASQMHAHQASGGRLDKTLEFESKFLLPDGTFMQSNSKPSTPLRTARWSRLGEQDVRHSSDNRCNSRGSSSAMAEMLSPGQSPQYSPQRSISSPASGLAKGLIDEFKDTLYLLQEPRAALAQSMSQQRPSTSGSTNSDFDLEKFNRRNARKWQVLQNIDGDKDAPDEDLLFRAVSDVHSRPTTSGSVGSYRPKLFDPYPEEQGYSYGRPEPANVFQPVRGGGIAVRSVETRPNSAELARKLTRLNNTDHNAPRAPDLSRGYVVRPLSGSAPNDSFSIGQRAEMSLLAPSRINSHGSRNRYANVTESVEDQDFDNYSDYGL